MSFFTQGRTSARVVVATAVAAAALLAPAATALAAPAHTQSTVSLASASASAEENPGGTYVRTEVVAGGGGYVEIYRVSDSHYWGRMITGGAHGGVSILDADGDTAVGDDNGQYVFLTDQGHFGSWIATSGKNEFHGPGTFTIERDYTAVVSQTGPNQWEGKFLRPGGGAFLTLDTHAVDDGNGGLTNVYAGMDIVDPGGKSLYVVLSADGTLTSYDPATAPVEPAPGKCTATRTTSIGAAILAHLSNSPTGPRVYFTSPDDSGKEQRILMPLDRVHPTLPADAGIIGRIDGATTRAPKLITRTEGGGVPEKVTLFPAVPTGCHAAVIAPRPATAR
ncbi:hypothetical protein AB0J38_17185 [Streptomyces sp. NPDC050095]|uniref:hypothetical protein n=1 Tax=unclassified Streptomyces TaxID=2593676 RepID=UPI0034346CBC